MKKRYIYILSVIVLITLFTRVSNDNIGLIQKTKDFFIKNEISIIKIKKDYGISSYKFVQEIQNNYPGRITGSEKEKEMANFIISTLKDGGYSEKDIVVKSFEMKDAPRYIEDEIKNKFEGGKRLNFSQNIEVTKKGKSDKIILVGAHYDSVWTHGVDDNGSGVAIVLENALRMHNIKTPYTIRYVFFGAEEIGMVGSSKYVESLSDEEKENIILMINIDGILAGDYLYLYGGKANENGSVDKSEAVIKAYKLAEQIGLEMKLTPKGYVDFPHPMGQMLSDHAPFADMGVPYIYFESNNWEKEPLLRTEKHGWIMHTDKDDLVFLEKEFGERSKKALSDYSKLLYALLKDNSWDEKKGIK